MVIKMSVVALTEAVSFSWVSQLLDAGTVH